MPRTSLVAVAALCPASLLPAQIFAEVGDAGDLPRTAQQTTGAGNLSQITGTIGLDDVDVFLIQIYDTQTFQASTVGGAAFDTRLWLFDQDGRGVTMSDDLPGGVLQSRITGQFVLGPGRYYLAIAKNGLYPITYTEQQWDPAGSPTIERRPDGGGRKSAVQSWIGNNSTGAAYTISLVGAAFAPNQVLLPGNHHLSESASQTSGSTAFFRSAPQGRFQVLYDGIHFTNAGVTGPVTLTRLQMRGEDGEQNRGGQIYLNVNVTLANTTLTANTMSSSFATNLSPATTTVGPTATITAKTIKRALGLCPNNDVVDLDLVALNIAHLYNPNGVQPNLLLDISYPNAGPGPNATNTIAIQNTTGGPAVVRGRAITAPSATATTGLFEDAPAIKFDISSLIGGDDALIPARVESIGKGCGGGTSAFTKLFPHGQAFDLSNDMLRGGIRITPDVYPSPTRYTVTSHSNPVDLTKLNPVPNTTVEDSFVTHVLPMALHFPGGSTTVIRADDNGHVRLTAAPLAAPWDPTHAKFLGVNGEGPMVAPCWHDFSCGRNVSTHVNAGLHVRTDGNDVWVTWNNVGDFNTAPTPGGQSVNTMQCLMKTGTGVLEFRYGATSQITGNTVGGNVASITGFSRGRIGTVPSVDPGTTDLWHELPLTTEPEGTTGNLLLTANDVVPSAPPHMPGRMFGNQAVRWNATNVPPGTVLGLQLIDLVVSRPGLSIPGITAPGCVLSTGTAPVIHEAFVLPGSTVSGTVPFTVPPGFDGTQLVAQFAAVSFPPAGGIQLKLSNGLLHTLGKQ